MLSSWSLVPRTPHDALERLVVDSAGLLTDETRLKALGVDSDGVTIRKLVGLLLWDFPLWASAWYNKRAQCRGTSP